MSEQLNQSNKEKKEKNTAEGQNSPLASQLPPWDLLPPALNMRRKS